MKSCRLSLPLWHTHHGNALPVSSACSGGIFISKGGTRISRISRVMATAMTPSLKASSRPVSRSLSSEASRSLPIFKDFHKGKIALSTAYYISSRERTARWRLLTLSATTKVTPESRIYGKGHIYAYVSFPNCCLFQHVSVL
jgi:hypothetical protein